jgi:isoquinoline 1-oxidoreductase beta subunit
MASYRAQRKGWRHEVQGRHGSAIALSKISAEFVFRRGAPMEPLNCTVQLSGQGANATTPNCVGTQMPGWTRWLPRVLGVAPETSR